MELLPFSRSRSADFWALRNINLRLDRGEILGVVGPNGSGKSTLLQIVTGILQPTTGRVVTEGRVSALLELGAGFNLEFTGRENVFLNAEIMGLSRAEAESTFPAIAEFAEIGEFMDRPVKEYSSGMYVRLAFAAAIHIRPEVLIVDEALAVGDAIFASRCIRKLEELKELGVSILLVSHDLGLVKRLCSRAMLMMRGAVVREGKPSEVVDHYIGVVHDAQLAAAPASPLNGSVRHGDGTSRITSVTIQGVSEGAPAVLHPGEALSIRIEAQFSQFCSSPTAGLLLRTRLGMDVFGTNSRIEGVEFGAFQAGECLRAEFTFQCLLAAGEYTLTVATQHADGRSQDWVNDALEFSVVGSKETAGVLSVPVQIHAFAG